MDLSRLAAPRYRYSQVNLHLGLGLSFVRRDGTREVGCRNSVALPMSRLHLRMRKTYTPTAAITGRRQWACEFPSWGPTRRRLRPSCDLSRGFSRDPIDERSTSIAGPRRGQPLPCGCQLFPLERHREPWTDNHGQCAPRRGSPVRAVRLRRSFLV